MCSLWLLISKTGSRNFGINIVGDVRGMGLLGCIEGVVSNDIDEKKQLEIDYEFGSSWIRNVRPKV